MREFDDVMGLEIWFDGKMLWVDKRGEQIGQEHIPTYIKRNEEVKVEVFENVKIQGSDMTFKVLAYDECYYVSARAVAELVNKTINYDKNLEMLLIGDSVVDDADYKVGVYSITQDQIKQKINELRKKFPDKKYWNTVGIPEDMANSDTVTNKHCKHIDMGFGLISNTCNSYSSVAGNGGQCYGFAVKLSDEIFGRDAPVIRHTSFEKAKIGDRVRKNNHSFVIINKTTDYVIVAECNYGSTCIIKWDRKVYKKSLEGATYMPRY